MAIRAEGILLDIDGVLVVSWEPVPGAAEAVDALRRAAMPLRFLTNTTSVTVGTIGDRLRSAGIEVADGEIVTAGVATAAHLRQHHEGARCFLLNDGPREDLDAAGVAWVDDPALADVVVVGGGGPEFSWETVNGVLRAVVDGASLVAMHGARLWQTADGPCLDGGAYVVALEAATGAEAVVVGKPAPAMFEAGLRAIGCSADQAIMVGDDVDSDVLAAQALGIEGVLVRTGKSRPEHEARSPGPDHVIDSVADLGSLIRLGP